MGSTVVIQLDVSTQRSAMPHCQIMVVVLAQHCAHLQQGRCRVWVHHPTLALFVDGAGHQHLEEYMLLGVSSSNDLRISTS